MRRGDNTVPSNYEPLPRVPLQAGAPRDKVGLDRHLPGRWSGSLALTLTAVDAVRVGSGVLFNQPSGGRNTLAQDLTLRGGAPIIPGSSIKGTIRQLVEALGGGCDQGCGRCVACSLFGTIQGSTVYKGRVGFDDALVNKGYKLGLAKLPRAFPPRKQVGRRIYGAAPVGARGKDPYFVLTRGSSLRSKLVVLNLDDSELGLLLTACGVNRQFGPRLGGGKYHGLGRTLFTFDTARLRRGPGRASVLDAVQLSEQIAQWQQAWKMPRNADAVLKILQRQMGI